MLVCVLDLFSLQYGMVALNTVYKFTCIVALVMYASWEGGRVEGHLLEMLLENAYNVRCLSVIV